MAWPIFHDDVVAAFRAVVKRKPLLTPDEYTLADALAAALKVDLEREVLAEQPQVLDGQARRVIDEI